VVLRRCAPLLDSEKAPQPGKSPGAGGLVSGGHVGGGAGGNKSGIPKLKLPGSGAKSASSGANNPFAWMGGVDARGRKLA
jgi:hypothetical protein